MFQKLFWHFTAWIHMYIALKYGFFTKWFLKEWTSDQLPISYFQPITLRLCSWDCRAVMWFVELLVAFKSMLKLKKENLGFQLYFLFLLLTTLLIFNFHNILNTLSKCIISSLIILNSMGLWLFLTSLSLAMNFEIAISNSSMADCTNCNEALF